MNRFLRGLGAALVLVSGFPRLLCAQDDLLQQLNTENKKPEYVIATFKGTLINNQQTVQLQGKGTLEFMILHRFGALKDLGTFFGLDQARIRLGLGYGVFDWWNLGVGRSTNGQTYDLWTKFRIARQRKGWVWPVFSVSWYSNMAINSAKWQGSEARPDIFSNRLSFVNQLLVARKFGERFSLQLAPTHVHYNLVPTRGLSGPPEIVERSNNSIFILGTSARFKVSKRVALTAEYNWIPPGQVRGYYDSFGVGIDLETGGHIFQLLFGNSRDMIAQQFMARNNSKVWKGDFFFGFNISRVFSVLKPKEFRMKKGKGASGEPEATAPQPSW